MLIVSDNDLVCGSISKRLWLEGKKRPGRRRGLGGEGRSPGLQGEEA